MQIHNLVTTIDNMSEDQLLAHVRAMRHRREIIRPAAAKRVERAEKKVSRAKTNKVTTLLDNMSEEDCLKLIAMLTNQG